MSFIQSDIPHDVLFFSSEKTKEVKIKGGKERYTNTNAEFQIIARREKKAFLSDQCKEIEGKYGMVRLEISSRKLEISSEYFMQRLGTIKDRNGVDLTKAEDIQKWQIYTEELYKKRS